MTHEPQSTVLDLRSVSGIEATVTTPSSATGGEYVEMDCTLEPGNGTTIHYHPAQEETYEVIDGTLEVFYDEQWQAARADESFAIPRGTVHGFRNTSETPVRFLNVHRPALGFQEHLEALDRLIRMGKIRGTKDPRSLIYLSMSGVEHQPDVTVKPPQWVVKLLAFVGRRLGYTLESESGGNRKTTEKIYDVSMPDAETSRPPPNAERVDVIENPLTGSRITFLERRADTDGEYVRFEDVEAPGAQGPPLHVHPHQTETFDVVSGRLVLQIGDEEVVLREGESTSVPAGTPHRFWNETDEKVHTVGEIRPAMHFESFLKTLYGLARDGKTNGAGVPNLLQMAVIARAYWDDNRLAGPPEWLLRVGVSVLAPVGRVLGYRARYPEYSDPDQVSGRRPRTESMDRKV